MGDTNYLSRVIKHPQFVLNENFILHPVASLSTSRKIIKNNLPLIDCIKKLTGDTTENIKRYYEDIANNSELEKYLQTQFDEYNSYINSKDFKISKFFKENPAGRLNRPSQGHAGFFLYILVRSLKPEFFLETGVSAGESSTYILQAMHDNNFGKLFSIDFPSAIVEKGLTTIMPEGKTSGWAIPENLKDRWELSLGKSEELLPKILERQKKIDVFMHDSLHTYDHMMFEYKTSWDFMRNGGILFSDDVAIMNKKGRSPFVDFAKMHKKDIVVNHIVGAIKK